MRPFIVWVQGSDGSRRWATIQASSAQDARDRVTLSGLNYIPIAVYEDVDIAQTHNPDELANINAGSGTSFGTLPMMPAFGGGGGGGGLTGPDVEVDPEKYEFGPSFLRALRGRGINIGPGGGLLGSQIREAQEPLFSRFYGSTALTPGSEADSASDVSFANFIANQQGQNLLGRGGAQQARNLLNKAMGFTSFGQDQLPSSLAGSFLNPATTDQGINLANIAREAGRQRFGSLARFLPSAWDLSQDYLSQEEPSRGTFANFLNRRIFG
jgi:hypothetical protein